ncbi:hypothetical protein OKA04_16950 [Luteolibacter flavescens]|uniref:Glycosyltransferase subfamily 4-like N-terminal domain-containing protein n=1 Tax=Luteolibacter flavescens TaxID=1859460 RepID=A0ABT3FT76_9BACT|nr:hypothetical protein [Luteolibacter flavescens]MCW1886429.1 hypothetical protein [Luteolibacter flavescens]
MSARFAVAIVHYHLRHGGVTRVIHTASACLGQLGIPHVILSGEPDESGAGLPVRVIDGLGYCTEGGGPDAGEIVCQMQAAVIDELGPGPVVWHFHNHSLGRNTVIADVVARLARTGEAMVLQLHDLAEDGRPMNYPLVADAPLLYPHSPRIRLAFLNSRDRERFHAAGLPKERSVLLANPVTAPAAMTPPSAKPDRALVLYPVRGIRRKNLGELFLLAALSPPGTRYAVSRAPDAGRWTAVHEEWRTFADESRLPVMLDVVDRESPAPGADSTFGSWLGHATHCITTSVAEGFGLGFLEPAMIGKPLLGRDLSAVTGDFRKAGITAGRLYEKLLIPLEWIGAGTLRDRLSHALMGLLDSYGHFMSDEDVEHSYTAMLHDGHLDFGNLPEDLQRHVIRRVTSGDGIDHVLVKTYSGIEPAREWLRCTLELTVPTATPADLLPYSADCYGLRLQELYRELLAAPAAVPDEVPRHRVLAEYLSPESFHFLLS